MQMPDIKENPLGLSWHNSAWIPMLNPANIMEYFCDRSNPFYDRTCNNEIIKMQRMNPEQLSNMNGTEYSLLHVQEPILYVIRKQLRHSSSQTTPITDYYIIAGIVYQAPDICTVVNSRLLSAVNHLQSAFDEALTYSRYHPSKGYWWEFKDKSTTPGSAEENAQKGGKDKSKDEPSSIFQRQRVDILLAELAKRCGPKFLVPPVSGTQTQVGKNGTATQSSNSSQNGDSKPNSKVAEDGQSKVDVKAEGLPSNLRPDTAVRSISKSPSTQTMKPPPDKKPKLE